MDPVISITTIPIEIKMTTKLASLEYVKGRGTAELEISRSGDGNTSITSRNIKVDSFEPRDSSLQQPGRQFLNSMRLGYQVTGVSARQGELVVNARVAQEFANQFASSGDDEGGEAYAPAAWQGMAQFQAAAPSFGAAPEQEMVPQQAAPSFDINNADMEIRLAMDQQKFGFQNNVPIGSFEYTPGSIEFTVVTRPKTVIEYIGGPIYVPPSSDPDYEQIDTKV